MDIKTEIPCYIHVTDGKVHEVNVLDIIEFEVGGFYVMDRRFVDYGRLFIIHHQLAYFVTRAKTNMKCRRLYSAKVDRSTGVMYDQTIMLVNFYALKEYPEKLRRIKYTDSDTNKQFIFLTNNFELPALQVALLYKYRWEDRTVLQMDKTTLEGKVVLGAFRERRKGSGLYCHHHFCCRITTIAPESSVLFKQVGGTPILTLIPFSFSDINITNGYYIEIIVSPTINRTDGQIMGGFGGSTRNQDFSSLWGNGQFLVTCVATN